MANLNLVPVIVADVLNKASVNIPNGSKGSIALSHPILAVDASIHNHFNRVATFLGIDLNEVKNVVDYAKDANGKLSVYYPCVKNVAGVASLVWGKLVLALTDIAHTPTFTGEKYVNIEYDLEGVDGDIDIISIPLRANKDYKPTLNRTSARTLHSKGKLAEALSTGFSNSSNIKELQPGVYNIIGAKEVVGFQGAQKFEVNIEGHGWYSAPNKVAQKLNALGYDNISAATPWNLELGDIKVMKGADGRETQYRDVVYISTSNIGAIDFSAYSFEVVTLAVEPTIPSSLLDLDNDVDF